MKYTYTAIFTPKENGKGFYCRIPDLPGCITTGKDLPDSIEMIADAGAGCLAVLEDEGAAIPPATPQADLPLPENAVCSLICIDTTRHRKETNARSVRKNVSIPAWMADAARKQGINLSQALQESLRERISMQNLERM